MIKKIPNETPDKYLSMPKGLSGYWWETKHIICIPLVISENPGKGTFSKWLDELEKRGKIVFVPTPSKRMQNILLHRGYKPSYVIDKQMGFVAGLYRGKRKRKDEVKYAEG